LVSPPSNHLKKGGSSPLKARRQGSKSSGRSGATGSRVSASQPRQAPRPSSAASSQATQAPAGPISDANQWISRRAISPWYRPGSAAQADRAVSQSSRVRIAPGATVGFGVSMTSLPLWPALPRQSSYAPAALGPEGPAAENRRAGEARKPQNHGVKA